MKLADVHLDSVMSPTREFPVKEDSSVDFRKSSGLVGFARRIKRDYIEVAEEDAGEEGDREADKEVQTAADDGTSKRLAIFCGLNVVYVVLQLWGSMAFGSLALLSDGFHNLSDV